MRKLFGKTLHKFWLMIDRILGTDFEASIASNVEGNNDYSPISLLGMFNLYRLINKYRLYRMSVVDVGCGKGRALWLFYKMGFQKIGGVEYDSNIAEIARRNMQHLNISEVSIFNKDAAYFDEVDDYELVFLYNPFGQKLMEDFLHLCLNGHSLQDNKQQYMIYLNPVHHQTFVDKGFNVIDATGNGKNKVVLYKG